MAVDRTGLREALARGICAARGTNPDCQHEGLAPDGAVDGHWHGPSTAIRPSGKVPWHYGWRKHIATADALLAGPLSDLLTKADSAERMEVERDEAREVVARCNNSFGSYSYHLNPHPAEQIEKVKEQARSEWRRAEAAQADVARFSAEVEALRAALDAAEACLSIVEPRTDRAEYMRTLGVVRAALSRADKADSTEVGDA